ncbi:MAG: pantoate--beta-alanine ligase [Candidatus Baltobacteraceae bacterium]
MRVATTIAAAREEIAALGRPVALVPTMGALHAGHLELIAAARNGGGSVVASVFVNPLQFAAGEDFERYPRDFEGDRAKFGAAGVDLLFAPSTEEIYPPGFSTTIDVGPLGAAYEGAARPTHFAGVATIVAKLLNIVGPDTLVLGQKDAQQTAVIRKVVRDLAFPMRVQIVATVREADGLALSSRNAYLHSEQRAHAPTLLAVLEKLRADLSQNLSKRDAIARASALLGSSGQLEYLDLVDADSFQPLERLQAPAFIIGAARFGATRLLDNIWIRSL